VAEAPGRRQVSVRSINAQGTEGRSTLLSKIGENLFGLLFALQGFGMVGGSPMSNTTTWSVLGPIIVAFTFTG